MSWDVSVQRFSKRYSNTAEIPVGESCQSLGSPQSIREAISHFFPGTNWTDPRWGIVEAHNGSLEFNMGADLGVFGFMLHIRADESIVDQIVALLDANSWQGLDCSTGAFLEHVKEPRAGIRGWRRFLSGLSNERPGT